MRRAAWLRATITIAAYRGRYLITDGTVGDSPHMDPLGVSPASTDHQTQADDHQRARRALLPCKRFPVVGAGGQLLWAWCLVPCP